MPGNAALRATFLGHHSFLFSYRETAVLVDPLLGESFGTTESARLFVFPPRTIAVDQLPRLSAIVLTHDHEGHFDIPSLMRLDRRVPVLIPARSSSSMHRILEELGFSVTRMISGKSVAIDRLELLPIAGDHLRFDSFDEWDVLAYAIHDLDGHGSFFSAVDLFPTARMMELVRRTIERPGLWAYTNNVSDNPFQYSWRLKSRRPEQLRSVISEQHARLQGTWALPLASLIVGGGFCFRGDQAWLNRESFPCTQEDIVRALSTPDHPFTAPEPGDTFVMENGALMPVERNAALIAGVLPRPERGMAGELGWLECYSPATGEETLSERALDDLVHELKKLAEFLYGRARFRSVCSLSSEIVGAHRPTFSLMLLSGRAEDGDPEAYVFEYDPSECDFIPVESKDPVRDYAAVFECWATDLLASLRCEISPTAVYFGRCRLWNAFPSVLDFDFLHDLIVYMHSLRHPDRMLTTYRQIARSSLR